jgi:Na+-translocating ferredoxin:NAD+ oxidoreductase subunit G
MTHTDHNNNSMLKITLNLTMAAFMAGVTIAVVFYFTAPIAAIQRIKQKEQSMRDLVPNATAFIPIEGQHEWFRAEKDGELQAYLILTHEKGFDGHITMFVAASADIKVLGFKIVKHKETPGLGDVVFKPKFADQLTGKGHQGLELVKIPEEGKITAVTGATITSRAVTTAVKRALIDLETFLNKPENETKDEAAAEIKKEHK